MSQSKHTKQTMEPPRMFTAMRAAHALGFWIRAARKPGRPTRYSVARIGGDDTLFSADDIGEIINWLRMRLH